MLAIRGNIRTILVCYRVHLEGFLGLTGYARLSIFIRPRKRQLATSDVCEAIFRIARHPAAIRTGTSTTWLHRWAMYSRMSSGPSWSVERWKYFANYTPMSSDHGCERLSHDQPIVLFPTVNYWNFARHVRNAEQCAQGSPWRTLWRRWQIVCER